MTTCTAPGCESDAYKRQILCRAHYEVELRARRKVNGWRRPSRADPDRYTPQMKLDDLAWMLERGEWPPRACERLAWSVSAANKAARTYDRPDIANVLDPFRPSRARDRV